MINLSHSLTKQAIWVTEPKTCLISTSSAVCVMDAAEDGCMNELTKDFPHIKIHMTL